MQEAYGQQAEEELPLIRTKIAKTSRFKKVISSSLLISKHAFAVFEETTEGFSVAYSIYLIPAADPNFDTRWAYLFVAFGGISGGINEICHLTKTLSAKKHEQYRIILETLAGASVAGVFAEDFIGTTTLSTVLTGGAIAFTLATSESLLEIFRDKPFFKTKVGKVTQYGLGSAYNLLMAAGICDYLFSICEGFYTVVPLPIKYGVTATFSLLNVTANLPAVKNLDKKNIFYHPTQLFRASQYGCEISLFLFIFFLDIYTDIQKSQEISNKVFYSFLTASLFQGFLVIVNKLFTDNKHEHEHEEMSEIEPEKAPARKTSSFSLATLGACCHSFWHWGKKQRIAINQTSEKGEDDSDNNVYHLNSSDEDFLRSLDEYEFPPSATG